MSRTRKSSFIVDGHQIDMEYDGYLTAFVDFDEVYCEDATGEDECLEAIEDALGFALSENVRHFQGLVIVDHLINDAMSLDECLDMQRNWEAKRTGLCEISVDMWRKSEGSHNAIHYEYDGYELHECGKRGIFGEYSVLVPESDRAKVEALAEAERLTWADSWEVVYRVNVDEFEEE